MKKAILYLHGFNSASLDLKGQLLTSKNKLKVLDQFCKQNNVLFDSPNIDYRHYSKVIKTLLDRYTQLTNDGYKVLFMGSSLGGFTSEYMAMKTKTHAIMINPATTPSDLLKKYIGVIENFELHTAFDWMPQHCEQFKDYENEIKQTPANKMNRILLLDMGDELIDSAVTVEKYQSIAEVTTFAGGSHSFEHMAEALPLLNKLIRSV